MLHPARLPSLTTSCWSSCSPSPSSPWLPGSSPHRYGVGRPSTRTTRPRRSSPTSRRARRPSTARSATRSRTTPRASSPTRTSSGWTESCAARRSTSSRGWIACVPSRVDLYTAAHGNPAQRGRGLHLGDPDLPGAPALRQGRRPLRCVRHRRRRQRLRRGLAGRAEPDPVDHLLRDPLGVERDRHPQALGLVRLRAATLLVIGLLALAGCGSGNGGTRVSTGLPPAGGGGTLPSAPPALPSPLDPLAARTRAEQIVSRQLYEPLIERLSGPYAQAAPQAGLALEARPSRDRTTWTVTLRPGVRFQDGTPFNAAAVLANSRRWQSEPGRQTLLPHLFAVDAPRPDEVRFLLDQPVPD